MLCNCWECWCEIGTYWPGNTWNILVNMRDRLCKMAYFLIKCIDSYNHIKSSETQYIKMLFLVKTSSNFWYFYFYIYLQIYLDFWKLENSTLLSDKAVKLFSIFLKIGLCELHCLNEVLCQRPVRLWYSKPDLSYFHFCYYF